MEIKNVFSAFDGLSCGQIALHKINNYKNHYKSEIDPNKINYYASEIEPNSIKVTQHNFPNTIQVGDICNVKGSDLPKIDLLLGGSPCVSFSRTISNNTGFDGKSKLFFEFVRILKETKPKFFLFENVMMKKEWEDIITNILGYKPIYINSERFSAQSRPRTYWTNIPVDAFMPRNELVLNDVLETNVDEKYFYNESYEFHGYDKVVCATLNINGHDILKRVNSPYHKCQTLTAVCGGNQQKKTIQYNRVRKLTPVEYERLSGVSDGYTSIVSDSARYRMLGNGWETNTIAYLLKNLRIY